MEVDRATYVACSPIFATLFELLGPIIVLSGVSTTVPNAIPAEKAGLGIHQYPSPP